MAGPEADQIGEDMSAIFSEILDLPKPQADADKPLQLQISNIGSDPFIGRLGIGRIISGSLKKNSPIGISGGPGTKVRQVKISELFNFDAAGRAPIDEASAGGAPHPRSHTCISHLHPPSPPPSRSHAAPVRLALRPPPISVPPCACRRLVALSPRSAP